MRKFLQESKILLVFFMLLTAATVMSYVDLDAEKVASRSPEEIINSTKADNTFSAITVETQRAPASIESQKSDMLETQLFCKNNEQARFKKVAQSLVMLNLNLCKELKSSRHIWVKNVTNGFKAQVFLRSEKNFRTDFIQLNKGPNKLTIEVVLKDGQKRVQSLEIISGS